MHIKLEDVRKILILITSPKGAVSTSTMEEISNSMSSRAPKAVVRIGDYPRREREIVATMVNSQLTSVPRLEQIFLMAESQLNKKEEIARETEEKIAILNSLTSKLPTLD
jgi:cell division GTPase FtsZ